MNHSTLSPGDIVYIRDYKNDKVRVLVLDIENDIIFHGMNSVGKVKRYYCPRTCDIEIISRVDIENEMEKIKRKFLHDVI